MDNAGCFQTFQKEIKRCEYKWSMDCSYYIYKTLTSFIFVAFWILSVRFSVYLEISGRCSVPQKNYTTAEKSLFYFQIQ